MRHDYLCEQFRKNSLRLPHYDYRVNGFYFVTICTANRELFFGDIVNDTVVFSDLGQVANICWKTIPDHFSNVLLDEYVVMPNHIHGIVITDNRAGKIIALSTIVGSFKSAVTKHANRIQQKYFFKWQRGYHDRIISDELSLNKAREYIRQNPARWSKDKNNPVNVCSNEWQG
jgi:putative transposase